MPKLADSKKSPVTIARVKKTVAKQPPVEKIAKPVNVEMVPARVIPVQIAQDNVPQDIADAFNEDPAEPEPIAEKIVKAETAPAASFGQANHSFSGQ